MPKKIKQGTVVSSKMDKTIVVQVSEPKMHEKYKKRTIMTKNYKAHDAKNTCSEGDVVSIIENRPISSQVRWVLDKVIEAKK
ncbi:MAG: 30S ribosomal protein S17 [Candidatus Gastranaerophilales bacterium]|nr:30S ribosomal protein S17 [Candidatus Gastranaerophilales bacterium]